MNTTSSFPLIRTAVSVVIQRFETAIDRARMSVAYDEEASLHYQVEPAALWRLRVWLIGFIEGFRRHRKATASSSM